MREFLIAVLGAGLALCGALVQAFVARLHGRADKRRDLLIEAYSDYLAGLAHRVAVKDEGSKDEVAIAQLMVGIQKITAYAPSSVVKALAAFNRTSQHLSNEDAQAAMVDLVQAMRKSVGVESQELETDIRTVLFGATRFTT